MKVSQKVLCALTVLVCGLVGCASEKASNKEVAPIAVKSAAPSAVESKLVSRQEYEEAVGRAAECMSAEGVEFVNRGFNPVNNVYLLLHYYAEKVPKEKVLNTGRECRKKHLDEVEQAYGKQNAERMDPKLMTAVQACLADKGLPTTKQEKGPHDLLKTVPEARMPDLLDCVYTNAHKMYPGLEIEFP